MAIHTGEAQLRDEGNYFGQTVIRCARLRAIGHGDQILVSDAAAGLVVDQLPDGVHLADLGTHRLKDLGRPERVWQVIHPDLPATQAPLRSLDVHRHNLPVQLTPLIGRETDVAALGQLVSDERLVTLTGSGGVGKTRLALAVAAELLEQFPGGVWFVELASVADPDWRRIGGVGRDGSSSRPRAATRRAADRRALPRNERCSSSTTASISWNRVPTSRPALLAQHAAVNVLATAREPLGVPGEVTWRVHSLSAPPPEAIVAVPALGQYEAVRLFIDRARRARPTFVGLRGERSGHRADLLPARRHSARPGAGGRALPADVGGADRGGARRSVPSPHGRCPHGASPAADPGGVGRLELRPVGRDRAGALPSARGVRGELPDGRRRSTSRRRSATSTR